MKRLAAMTVALVLGAAAVLVVAPSRASAGSPALGVGPAVHPFVCGHAFDARGNPQCSWRHGPLAGGDRYCPLHGSPR